MPVDHVTELDGDLQLGLVRIDGRGLDATAASSTGNLSRPIWLRVVDRFRKRLDGFDRHCPVHCDSKSLEDAVGCRLAALPKGHGH
jgi:hypothetical protein